MVNHKADVIAFIFFSNGRCYCHCFMWQVVDHWVAYYIIGRWQMSLPSGRWNNHFYSMWIWQMLLQMADVSPAPLFQLEKHCACAGELLWFACASAGIPTDCFLPLCTDQFIFSTTQLLSLWHSPPDILVHPCTGALNLFTTHARTDTEYKCNEYNIISKQGVNTFSSHWN